MQNQKLSVNNTRIQWLLKASKTFIIFSLLFWSACSIQKPNEFVNPFVGTGGHGHCFPGAAYPFGMMQLSPDTRLSGWDGCSGYHYTDSVIYGFSHTHLSGTGVPDYCDVLFMPGTGVAHFENGASPEEGYRSSFDKSSEHASPGFYEVLLKKYGIRVSLTVGKRTGLHRYEFPKNAEPWLLIDLKHRDPLIRAGFTNWNTSGISGYRHSNAWARNQQLFFSARFSKPIRNVQFSSDSLVAVLYFDTGSDNEVFAQVGISAVDGEGAMKNLDSEFNHFNFKKLYRSTCQEWDHMLGRVGFNKNSKGPTDIFYTALYHCLIHPSLFQDADGRYRGMDSQVHRAETDDHYTVFSLWDTYRSTHPLYQLLYPEYNDRFIRTFLRQFEQCGHLPVWELAGNETWCMIGNHAIPVIANAFAHHRIHFDTALASLAIFKSLTTLQHSGLQFMQKGFIEATEEAESVSKTIENSLDFAAACSIHPEWRSALNPHSYANLYNPYSGFFQARSNNRFVEPFDPREVNFHYTEANAFQYLFGAHHDIPALMRLFNANKNASSKDSILESRLDQLFTSNQEMSGRVQADITGLIGQYAHGNEPSHHVAYLYNYTANPEKTQKYVRTIKRDFYKNSPDGLIGNEDCGQMSSWYVFSALGFYPVHPFDASYERGLPSFRELRFVVPGQQAIQISSDLDPERDYVQSMSINGQSRGLNFSISPGDHIHFSKLKTTESNYRTEGISHWEGLVQPFIQTGDQVFEDSTCIRLASIANQPIEYTWDTNAVSVSIYKKPVCITNSCSLFFRAKSNSAKGPWLYSRFFKKPSGIQLELHSEYSNVYPASGPSALVDGLRGGGDFRDGLWQGFQGKDLEADVTFSNPQEIKHIHIRFLQDQRSWILMPSQVIFSISEDGVHYKDLPAIRNDLPIEEENPVVKTFTMDYTGKVKYVKVKATNSGKMPSWHLGAGGDSWIFCDELYFE